MGTEDLSDLFIEGDPWSEPEPLRETLAFWPRPRKGTIICSMDWLRRIWPKAYTSTHLVIAMLVYSKCLERRCRTIKLSNRELRQLGISRQAKYRSLAWWQDAGASLQRHRTDSQSV
jgi:hypothetical protein